MKTILFLLSFMFVSCVTANTEGRDLSEVNTETEPSSADNTTCIYDCDYAECMDACMQRREEDGKPKKICWDICRGK